MKCMYVAKETPRFRCLVNFAARGTSSRLGELEEPPKSRGNLIFIPAGSLSATFIRFINGAISQSDF